MKKVLVWETLALISGGQKMTLSIMDMLKDKYCFYCLISDKGAFSDELDARGIPYTLLGDQTMPTGIKRKSVMFRYAYLSVKAIINALHVIYKEKPDMIYAPGPAALPWSSICGSITHTPVIWHLHHIFLDRATKKLLNICSGLKSVKKIISVSHCVEAQISNSKAEKKKITIYNPVNLERFSSGDNKKILNELNIDRDGKIIIGQIALLQRLKRQDIVVNTGAGLKSKGYDVRVIFAGRARAEDTAYVEQLHKLIEDADITENVIFLGQRSDVTDILKAVDFIMIPSSFEGFPLAGLEACAAGTPVLAANVGGSEEFINVSGAGLCFDYINSANAVEKAEQLIKLDTLKNCSEHGYQFVGECSIDNYYKNIYEAFKL